MLFPNICWFCRVSICGIILVLRVVAQVPTQISMDPWNLNGHGSPPRGVPLSERPRLELYAAPEFPDNAEATRFFWHPPWWSVNFMPHKLGAIGRQAPHISAPGDHVKHFDYADLQKSWGTQIRFDGLQNMGNTCYLNAVLQAIASLHEFTDALFDMGKPIPACNDGILYKAATDVLKKMRTARSPVSPQSVTECVGAANPLFHGRGQQDAHEFMLTFLDQLHEELFFCTR